MAEREVKRLPMYEAPDLGPLTIHFLNNMPSDEEEQTDTEKALRLMLNALKGLVSGLQGQFGEIDTIIEQFREDGDSAGAGRGGGGQKKNPYAVVQGDQMSAQVNQKVQEQESRLHEMTVQYMRLTGRVDKAEEAMIKLQKLAEGTATKVTTLVSEVELLKTTAADIADRVKSLEQRHVEFVEKIEPKFAPLENDVSVINGVLQLDKQHFLSKVGALSQGISSPLFAMYDTRLESLESDAANLIQKVKDWCGGCDGLFSKLARSRMGTTLDMELIPSQRSKTKTQRGVSFDPDQDKDDSEFKDGSDAQLGWKVGFEGSDLGRCLYFFHSVLSQMSTMEEMIKQWEFFHQSIDTRIDEIVVNHVDDKLSAVLQDPHQRDHAINLIHALSPNAEYHHVLTRLDMKVDKTHFQVRVKCAYVCVSLRTMRQKCQCISWLAIVLPDLRACLNEATL
jgi:hypothetical protein